MHEDYLRIRFLVQVLPWLTLSVSGVGRAYKLGRLPVGTEALLEDLGTWIPITHHPAVAPALAAYQAQPRLTVSRDLPGRERFPLPAVVPADVTQSTEEHATSDSLWRRRVQVVQRWAAAL